MRGKAKVLLGGKGKEMSHTEPMVHPNPTAREGGAPETVLTDLEML